MNLTAAQRSRLVALLVTAATISLAASEGQELAFLENLAKESGELDDIRAEALAAAHTQGSDADADGEDSAADDVETEDEDEAAETDDDDEENSDNESDDAGSDGQAARKTGFLGNAKNMLTSRTTLANQNSELRREVADLKAQLGATKASLKAVQNKFEFAKTRIEKLSADLAAAKKKEKTLSQSVTDELSQVGQPDAKLPGVASQGTPQQPGNEAELRVALKDCATEEERILLVRRFDKMRQAALN